MFEYFKLTVATAQDYEQLMWLLKNKRFYPELTSTPPLPAVPNGSFDYRELMILWGLEKMDGMPIVRTRSKYSLANFDVNVVPVADWTTRYKLSAPPTITAIANDLDLPATRTTFYGFLNYNYPNPQPGEI